MVNFIPRSFLIKPIMAGRFLLFFLFGSIATLHMRVHLKHFKLLLYICSFTHSNNDFATVFEHRIDCSIEKHRNRTLSGCGLRLMRLIFGFLSKKARTIRERWNEKRFIDQYWIKSCFSVTVSIV